MNDLLPEASEVLSQLLDFHLATTAILGVALLLGLILKQPLQRLTIAWASMAAIVLVIPLSSVPGLATLNLGYFHSTSVSTPSSTASVPVTQGNFSELGGVEFDVPKISPDISQLPVLDSVSEGVRFDLSQEIPRGPLLLFFGGSFFVSCWLAYGWIVTRRVVKQAFECSEATKRLLDNLDEGSSCPRLLISPRLSTAVAIGLRNPTILLPKRFVAAATELELRTVLKHELAHIHGGHLWFLAILRIAFIALWPNPLFWALRRRVRLDQERIADAEGAELTDRHSYAEQLTTWARQASSSIPLAGTAGLWENPSQFRQRVATLLDDRFTVLKENTIRWKVLCAAGCVSIATFVSLVTVGSAQSDSPQEPTSQNVADEKVGGGDEAQLQDSKTVFFPVASNRDYPDAGPGKPNVISGRCTDASGKPIQNAEVLLLLYSTREQTAEQVSKQRTDSEGRFTWKNVVPEDNQPDESPTGDITEFYTVAARAQGFASQSSSETPGRVARQGHDVLFVLNPAAKLTGLVTAANNRPVVGAKVRAVVTGSIDAGVFHTATTDEEGRYIIEDLRLADYSEERRLLQEERQAQVDANLEGDALFVSTTHEIQVTHPNFAMAKTVLERVPGNLDIQLRPASIVTGRAIDDDGKPVANARVVIQTAPPEQEEISPDSKDGSAGAKAVLVSSPQFHHARTRTDKSGRFRFSTLPAGRYLVRLDLEDWSTAVPKRIATGMEVVDATTSGESYEAPDLRVTEGRIVRLQLVDEATGQPLKFDKPMEVSGHFRPEGGSAFGIGVRRLAVSESGEVKCRITDKAGQLQLYQLHPSGVWASEQEWRPEPGIDVPVSLTDGTLPYKVGHTKASVEARIPRAHQLKRDGKTEEAIQYLTELLEESPDNAQLLLQRAGIATEAGKHADAITDLKRLLELKPRFLFIVQNNLAHLLATTPDERLRDADRAVELAKQAVSGSPRPMAQLLDTLAEAYAVAGDYGFAVETQEQAAEIASPGCSLLFADGM